MFPRKIGVCQGTVCQGKTEEGLTFCVWVQFSARAEPEPISATSRFSGQEEELIT